ncbi:MAG: energy transducer TonB [Cyclobacteriaceae bacterium]|nr:energy transducer TonB [Cyclobacteriaceae bacterium]
MKVNIMNQAPEVADEEIERYMKFDNLLALKKAADARKLMQVKIITVSSIITGVILFSLYLFNDNKVENQNYKELSKEIESAEPELQTTPPIALPLEKEKREPEKIKEQKFVNEKPISEKRTETKSQVPVIGYQEAEPVLGYTHLYEYLNQELTYPPEALADSIQGILTVSFIINKEGKPENISIQNSLGQAFDREALLLINNMPAWKPALRNNNPTPSKVSLPLTFQIKKVKIKKP